MRVPAAFPARGSVSVLIFGEAPGPNGADKSGVPFFGDRAGLPVYEVLEQEGRCRFTTPIADIPWSGSALKAAGTKPVLTDTALSNAYPVCPTDDGEHFRAPSRAELRSDANVKRVQAEIAKARRRGLRTIIVLGRTADWFLGTHLGYRDDEEVAYRQIPHPSPLAFMGMARRAGKGVRASAMKARWMEEFRAMLGDRAG